MTTTMIAGEDFTAADIGCMVYIGEDGKVYKVRDGAANHGAIVREQAVDADEPIEVFTNPETP